MPVSKALPESIQASLQTPVVNIASHLDSKAPQQIWICHKRDVEAGAVFSVQAGLQGGLKLRSEISGALNSSGPFLNLKFHQTMKM